jgi:hypothetical protein
VQASPRSPWLSAAGAGAGSSGRRAGPAAKALIEAAMDARRLGHSPALPHALLEAAAPGS